MPAEQRPASPAAAGLALGATVKYNPHLWAPDELRAIFVVRTRELADPLARLRATADGQVAQHLLITGAGGMGRTTLLRRLALAVADDPDLAARWIAVTFPEEQYTVSTLAELWRNVLNALADAREREGASPAELKGLDAEIRRIGELPIEAREAAALTALTAWVAANRKFEDVAAFREEIERLERHPSAAEKKAQLDLLAELEPMPPAPRKP